MTVRGVRRALAASGRGAPLAPQRTREPGRRAPRALCWVALLAAACVPPALDETGRRCSADRPCSEEYFCVEERCALDAAVPDAGSDGGLDAGADAGRDAGFDAGFDAGVPFDVNLLQNPGFEELTADGGVRAWRATNNAALVTALPGKSSPRAGKVVPALFDVLGLQPAVEPVKGAEQGQLYCARVSVKSNLTRPFVAVLQIRDRDSFGTYQSSNGTQLNVADGGWVSLEESYSSLGLGRLDIRLSSNARVDAGETFWVDDALLFRASKSVCQFP